ncbi:MAG: stage V sporulation protein SpoVM [Clostridia bacterium]|nr:stage V sporulation protein SpoVM [Clostridia bacterium]
MSEIAWRYCMKVVVVRSPKALRGILKVIFKIKDKDN